jgi:ribosomal protein S18 acetylase RimI-like enzyme
MDTLREGGRPVRLRTGRPDDARFAAELHVERIQEGFLSQLGISFLTRLYRRVVAFPDSFLLIADRGAEPVGFLAGTVDIGGLYRRFLLRDGVSAGVVAAPQLVRSLPRVMETLRYGAQSKGPGPGPVAELLAVAVSPKVEGQGLGRMLVAAFFDELSDRGTAAAKVVVGGGNSGAISLYRRAGFGNDEQLEVHRGSQSLVMYWPTTRSGPIPLDGP